MKNVFKIVKDELFRELDHSWFILYWTIKKSLRI